MVALQLTLPMAGFLLGAMWFHRVFLGCLAAALGTVLVAAGQPEGAAVAKADRVNLRARPSVFSEVVGQIHHGDEVVILENVRVKKPKEGDLDDWVRIDLPSTSTAWVHTSYIDAATHTVKPRRLNVRAGPGENYSVLGRLAKDDAVTELSRTDEWMEIEAPPGTSAFVAASCLERSDPGVSAPPRPKSSKAPDRKRDATRSAPAPDPAPAKPAEATNAPTESTQPKAPEPGAPATPPAP